MNAGCQVGSACRYKGLVRHLQVCDLEGPWCKGLEGYWSFVFMHNAAGKGKEEENLQKEDGGIHTARSGSKAMAVLPHPSVEAPHPSVEDIANTLHQCWRQRDQVLTLRTYAYMCNNGLEAHRLLGNYLVLMLNEVGNTHIAQQVFDRLTHRPERSWNSLISGYINSEKPQKALILYERMEDNSIIPSGHTFVALLKACTKLKDWERGFEIHANAARAGMLEKDIFVGSTLVDMYAKCGLLAKAQEIFNHLPARDVVSWNALITGYTKHGHGKKAINCFESMQFDGFSPTIVTYVSILKACSSIRAMDRGGQIHAEIKKNGMLERSIFLGNTLVDMYAKCGFLLKAQEVFDELHIQDVVSWNALITGYTDHGHDKEALKCFEQMQEDGVFPDAVTFACALKACGSLGAIDKGQEIHAQVDRNGLLKKDPVVGNALIDMYAKCGLPFQAQHVLNELPVKNTIAWNALMAGYAKHGYNEAALHCFEQMQLDDISPDSATYICSFKASCSLGRQDKVCEIHAEVERNGLLKYDSLVGSTLVDTYVKCGLLARAQEVFDRLPRKSVLSWTTLISGYVENGYAEESLKCFEQMQVDGFSPDSVTYVCSLKACGSIKDSDKGEEIHTEIVRRKLFKGDLFVGSALVDMYAKCGLLAKAHLVFDKLTVRDVVIWNALLAGYTDHGHGEEAIKLYEQMQSEGVSASDVTLVCILKACSSIENFNTGEVLHAELGRLGLLESNLFVGNTLVDMYAKWGLVDKAQEVFDRLPSRDITSWNTLLTGYVKHGLAEEAIKCFEQMTLGGVCPDSITFVCSLKACGSIGSTDKGFEIHAEIERKGLLEGDSSIGNTLVDMYAKCGLVAKAREVFDKLPVQDIVSWTALISGYAEHGHCEEALSCLQQMQVDGCFPDDHTFVCSLKACGNLGATCKGREIHAEIERTGLLERNSLVGNTLVNMYVKCGLLAKAQQVFDKLPARDVVAWNALLAGYIQLGESENAFYVFDIMLGEGIKPGAITFTIVLNACSRIGQSDKGKNYFEAMSKDYGIMPMLEHHTCMIDLLCREGHLDQATLAIKQLLLCADLAVWRTLLASCSKWGNLELGKQVFEQAIQLDKNHSAAYIFLSKLYMEGVEAVTSKKWVPK